MIDRKGGTHPFSHETDCACEVDLGLTGYGLNFAVGTMNPVAKALCCQEQFPSSGAGRGKRWTVQAKGIPIPRFTYGGGYAGCR